MGLVVDEMGFAAVLLISNWARWTCGAWNKPVRCPLWRFVFSKVIEVELEKCYILKAKIHGSSLKIMKEEKNNAKPNET